MIYEFLSPMVTDILSMKTIREHFDEYMNFLGDKGLAVYLRDALLKPNIIDIYLVPTDRFHILSIVKCKHSLSNISRGVLEDYLESEFIYHVNTYFIENQININVCDTIRCITSNLD